MRRKDREVTDAFKIEEIIAGCHCCRLGFNDDGEIYILPLNFGWEKQSGGYVLYFHGAREGRKIDLIGKNPHVGFEMDRGYQLRPGDVGGECTASFQSIIGNGVVEMVEDPQEKIHGLTLIMEHNVGKREWTFAEPMLRAVVVFKLTVTKMSSKEHE